jgi:alkylhydroperoxidase/carboxymuconolactone decarboxylase family protein
VSFWITEEAIVNYYESKDLKKFKEVGNFAPELMKKFFDYYNSVISQEGALTKREKALIALAVSHNEKCPYCIDAYTTACLENGSNPEQMTEAIHVAAAMRAGIALIHGVQMQNVCRANGAL